jgi:glycerophosphoryl diester phosphodiesterase
MSRMKGAAPIVIGHRGASGYVPEHTLASYFLAIQYGADSLEPDLVMSRDGVLIVRHENELGGTTDVAAHREFASRWATKQVDGTAVSGWFSEDFTLRELKTLRARERIPDLRPGNTRFDGQFELATFEEILALVQGVQQQRAARARQLGLPPPAPVGLYPEIKHASYFANLGLAMQAPLLALLGQYGYHDGDTRVWPQSFEVGFLQTLRGMTRLPLVQLIEDGGAPFDLAMARDARSYADLITAQGLKEIARYAQAIGPAKSLVIPRRANGTLGSPTTLVADAHAAGLAVNPWTFRLENEFLPADYRRGSTAAGAGDLQGELLAYLRAGIDGFFTDQADVGVSARTVFLLT